MQKLFIAITLLFLYSPLYSSDSLRVKKDGPRVRSLDFGIAPTSYVKGDLNPQIKLWSSTFHIGYSFMRAQRVNGHLHFFMGSVTGQNPDVQYSDKNGATTNNYFYTSLVGLNYDLRIHILKRARYGFYFSQGIGLLRFSPKDAEKNGLQDQLNTRALGESYNNITMQLPTGLGAYYTLPQGFGLGFQATRLNQTSDYLDNISSLSTFAKADRIVYYQIYCIVPLP